MTNSKRAQVWLFILPCLLITGVLMLFSAACHTEEAAAFFAALACFIPALTAITICLIKHIKISELAIFPGLKDNVRVYAIVILIAVVIALMDEPLIAAVFPNIEQFQDFDLSVFILSVLTSLSFALVGMITLLGEEIGWLGYLFPRLEQLHGTVPAVVLMGIIRGLWHLVMFLAMGSDTAWVQFVVITVSNVLLDSLFVCTLKKTSSIIPAALVHSITNILPGAYGAFVITNEELFAKNYLPIQMVSIIPAMVVGIVCYGILLKTVQK